jgi:hypothetical protein
MTLVFNEFAWPFNRNDMIRQVVKSKLPQISGFKPGEKVNESELYTVTALAFGLKNSEIKA